MFNYRWLLISSLCSFSAFGNVDFEEKKNRVEYLENLSKTATSMNIEAFRRELKYEEQGLSLEQRAVHETRLLAEKIKLQVIKAYEEAVKEHGNGQEAVDEVREAIERDLGLVDGDLQEELRALAFSALDNVQKGEILATEDLPQVQQSMLKGVQERADYLNKEEEFIPEPLMITNVTTAASSAKYNKDKHKLLSSLVSEEENDRRVMTAAANMKSTNLTKFDRKISLQVKVNFLGVAVEAGPTINFTRQYITNFDVSAEGMQPPLNPEGQFDFTKRDSLGRNIVKNGKAEKRKMNFVCEGTLKFATEYSGAGSFSAMGIGGSAVLAKDYSNTAEIVSRRVSVPETIGDKMVTHKMLAEICHNDFLRTKVTNTMTVASSLNIMMKNIIAGLSFSHPKTKCAADSQCQNWYKNEIIALAKRNNVARCVENSKEKYFSCELRGREGQACAVYNKNGRRVSGNGLEFTCDKGLYCKTVRPAGFILTAIGQCSKR
ncbi:MAG: hypothetical protein NDI69_09980 [Bacteriovoracaceae bacterium]|nr:hypothetical protein [Bacteriovoracaceae bacterium]